MKNSCGVLVSLATGLLIMMPSQGQAVTLDPGQTIEASIDLTESWPAGDTVRLEVAATLTADGGCSSQKGACVYVSSPGGDASVNGGLDYEFGADSLGAVDVLVTSLFGTYDVETSEILCNSSFDCSSYDGFTVSYAPYVPLITPLPPTLPFLAAGLTAIGLFGWWRKRKAQAVA